MKAKKIFVALAIGLLAGIVDIIPMIILHLSWQDILSAFLHWLVLGLVVPFVKWPIKPWLKGMLLAVLFAIPVMAGLLSVRINEVPPILLSSLLLGAFIGWAGNKWVAA